MIDVNYVFYDPELNKLILVEHFISESGVLYDHSKDEEYYAFIRTGSKGVLGCYVTIATMVENINKKKFIKIGTI